MSYLSFLSLVSKSSQQDEPQPQPQPQSQPQPQPQSQPQPQPQPQPLLNEQELHDLCEQLHRQGLAKSGLPPKLDAGSVHRLLATAAATLSREPNCLLLKSPILIFGDFHGEFHSLVKLTEMCGRPPTHQYLFLGDYVDRGAYSIETMVYLLLMKALHPASVHLLRGNHEDRRIYRFFNFESDLMRTFGHEGLSLSKAFHQLFCLMPVCAVLNSEIFCCHGGLSPHFNHPEFAVDLEGLVRRVNELEKPLHFRKSDFVADLLWSDTLDSMASMPVADEYPDSLDELLERWADRSYPNQQKPAVSTKHRAFRRPKRLRPLSMEATSCSNSDSLRVVEWAPNARGCSFAFTKAACERFLKKYGLRWVIRAHMFAPSGFKFDLDGQCLTLFSAADYAQRFSNPGALLFVHRQSRGAQFPGQLHTFHKKRLLRTSQRLPPDPREWPEVIA